MSETLLTIPQACQKLNCKPAFLRRLRQASLIETVKLGEKYVRIPESSIDKLIDKLRRWDNKVGGNKPCQK